MKQAQHIYQRKREDEFCGCINISIDKFDEETVNYSFKFDRYFKMLNRKHEDINYDKLTIAKLQENKNLYAILTIVMSYYLL